MSMHGDFIAEAHFDNTPKSRCGVCSNCQTVSRWNNSYWQPYIKNGGDSKWAKRQLRVETKALPCQRSAS